ncbi:winged helix-turn-helix domain-containing protein [Enhygromyxa salina]|uniref:5-methylcytosine-specific restriction enzyme B n=1 Tax=Enhygromyxa salina TaxID=215803 RepID=A0A2S9XPW2_9BACT|nr:winged helix-turn-helix domain-containing protein [Enhygromyxa salina]PRP94895.1 5-methylcytosine-specific restriction enzyme B [Enhygromyxa salina]
MTNDPTLEAAEASLAATSSSHRPFFVPVTRALSQLGGRARKQRVVIRIRELLAGELTEGQLDYLESKNRFGWARHDLKHAGLIVGEYGWWELTELGRAHARAHESDPLSVDLAIPEATEPIARKVQTDTVEVTAFKAYEVPILEALALNLTDRGEILERVERHLGDRLRPGDLRLMPGGVRVFEFRAAWALSNLGKRGLAENPQTGQWKITPAGRLHLEQERDGWDPNGFAPASAKVRADGSGGAPVWPPPTANAPAHRVLDTWQRLRPKLGKPIHDALTLRLAPQLGASPDLAPPRNLIFYGPPGTGKTHVAKQVARALTGEDAADEDGRFRLVQFHPSYAYEDFIQGLRPDIKQTTLRYEQTKGPFVQIAEAAGEDPDNFYVLVIDEINRGDPARIFGELLYALEYRGESVTLALGGKLVVPPNLVVIGTMNSVDRSVALVDYALRRRFGFVRVDPNPEVVGAARVPGLIAEVGPGILDAFNQWIAKRLDRDHQIGHSYFLSPALVEDGDPFGQLWAMDIRPLLEEYFFGDEQALAEADGIWRAIVSRELSDRQTLQDEDDELEEGQVAEP